MKYEITSLRSNLVDLEYDFEGLENSELVSCRNVMWDRVIWSLESLQKIEKKIDSGVNSLKKAMDWIANNQEDKDWTSNQYESIELIKEVIKELEGGK